MKHILITTILFAETLFRAILINFWKIHSFFIAKITLPLNQNRSYLFVNYGEITARLYSYRIFARYGRGFENKTIQKFEDLIKPGDVVFDIGANIGMYTLLASDIVGVNGSVYSFEPVKATNIALNKNVELNKFENVHIYSEALSNSVGKAKIGVPNHAAGNRKNDAFNSLYFDNNSVEGQTIRTLTLDKFIQDHHITKIDFIKVDIEGAELLFFEGARDTLEIIKPKVIVFEAYESYCEIFGYSISDIIILLNSYGYNLKQYDEWQWIATNN